MGAMRFALAATFALLAAVASAGPGAARANGVPQLVKLTYLEGISNWGPKDGEGVLEFSFAEAYAIVNVKNLKPSEGLTYEGWLTGGEGAPLLVGTIAVNASGIGLLDTRLQNLKRYDYNTFVVAARGQAVAEGEMPPQRSIAGRFTVLADGAAGASAGDVRPAELPNTGERAPRNRLVRVGFTMLAAASLALVFKRTRKRSRSS
ncbi:MAG: hypothetical protein C0506_10475 [Anaerolinea sp.]|nr:hypothetical protein [Anaerolinea sp.]